MGQIDSGANAERQFLQCPSKFGCLWHQQSNLSAFPEKIFRAICDAICVCWLIEQQRWTYDPHSSIGNLWNLAGYCQEVLFQKGPRGHWSTLNSHGESPCSLASLAWNGQLVPERPLFFSRKTMRSLVASRSIPWQSWNIREWDLIIRYYNLYHLI